MVSCVHISTMGTKVKQWSNFRGAKCQNPNSYYKRSVVPSLNIILQQLLPLLLSPSPMELLKLLLLLLLIVCFHGFLLIHGLKTDQASTLMAFRADKMRRRWASPLFLPPPAENEEWVERSGGLGGGEEEEVVGRMEEEVVEGGLPGQPSGVKFKQYAGYVDVEDDFTIVAGRRRRRRRRSLFYYFSEAVYDPSSKPLILWLNGGPGCSSLGGAMLEIGPFGVNPDGETLYLRRFSWNRVANVLFLESPAGVGFSYSNSTSDYDNSGDKRTAEDTYRFLVKWFKRFPHYKHRDFYIMGESYAGFYIPELADIIIRRNNQTIDPTTRIQLKGIMIGNGIMNDDTDARGSYDYLWSHALISDETYRGLMQQCPTMTTDTKNCNDLEDRIGVEAGKIDFSNIYGPLCTNFSNQRGRRRRINGNEYDPCEAEYVEKYLNLPQVQEALHANTTKLPYTWELCSNVIKDWKDSPSTMFPNYKKLIASGLRILLFSGDVDAVVPVSATRYSIDALNLKVIKPWHSWGDHKEEVAGYKVIYEGLTFATVRDAGHQVPQFQPRRAFALLQMFLGNFQ